MTDTSLRMHPLIVIAATTVILTCLLAIGIMTGLVPSPLARDRAYTQVTPPAPTPAPASRSALVDRAASPPAADDRPSSTTAAARAGNAERPPVGATSSAAPSNVIAGGERAPRVAAVCTNCGRVTSVRAVKTQGEAGLLGPAAGGAVGGLVGNQIGHGSGRTVATIIGAAGGAAAGTEIERRYKSTTHYIVTVRLNDGTQRTFNYASAPGLQDGDRVRVVEGRLVRDA